MPGLERGERVKIKGKQTGRGQPVVKVFGCGTLLTAFAEAGADLHVHRRETERMARCRVLSLPPLPGGQWLE